MAFAETQQLVVQLDLKGNLRQGLGSASRDLLAFNKATGRTQQSLSKFGRNLERGIAIGAGAVAGGLLTVVKAAADYEQAFSGVRKTVTATQPQLQLLSDQFRALAKTIPISAAELARLGEAGGALGVPVTNLKEFVRVTALLGVTTNLTADEAANSLGILGNVLHLTGDDYSKFASSLVALGNAGASTERDIVFIATRAGAAGKLIGLTTDQVLGFSSAVASLGIEAEAGGTALQNFYIGVSKTVAQGSRIGLIAESAGISVQKLIAIVQGGGKPLKTLADRLGFDAKDLKKAIKKGLNLDVLAEVAGISAKAFSEKFTKDASGAIQLFLKGLGKLSAGDQFNVLTQLGFADARITRTLLGLANNTQLVTDQMNIANQAFIDNTALTKEADQRFKTFDSQLQITKNVLTDMAITIGSKLLPKLTPLLQQLNDFVLKNQGKIDEFGNKLAAAFEGFATAVGKVDWRPYIDGLTITGNIAKEAIKLFMSLPPDVQKIAIAAFAVNKVTGGLGSSIIKDLAGLALNSLKTINAASVTVIGANVTGGGLPGGSPGTLPTGPASVLGAVGPAFNGALLLVAVQGLQQQLSGLLVKTVTGDDKIANAVREVPSFATFPILDELSNIGRVLSGDNRTLAERMAGVDKDVVQGTHDLKATAMTALLQQNDRDDQRLAAQKANAIANAEGIKQEYRAQTFQAVTAASAIKTAVDGAARAAREAGSQTSSAVERKKLSVSLTIPITTNVSVRDHTKVTYSTKRYGNIN